MIDGTECALGMDRQTASWSGVPATSRPGEDPLVLGRLKRHPIEACPREARGPVRAGFEAHPHDRRDRVVRLPIVGELLRKHLQEVYVVSLYCPCPPCRSAMYLMWG